MALILCWWCQPQNRDDAFVKLRGHALGVTSLEFSPHTPYALLFALHCCRNLSCLTGVGVA